MFNGNGVLVQVHNPGMVFNQDACFQTDTYTALGCTCWGGSYSACPASAPEFCRNCTKDWKKPRGAPGVNYAVGATATAGFDCV